ncbi:unnamed protein product [Periconia digitata]|uniref:Rhodopsin domain-containing protein n=1 Tax=Periconia digitata TaxID=1303443 RepID=A0A9W4UGM5_9PLEO|nr:unnamed protein product [Periconia digitata]
MSDTGLERVPSFLPEIWTWYGVGMFILFMRFAARLRTVGIRGLELDDFFASLVAIMYTCDAATVHLVYMKGSNVEAAAFQETRKLTNEEIHQYTVGSKLQLTAWYSYTALLWCLKGTMLAFFRRITTGLWHARIVRWMSYACGISYIAVVLTVTFGCFPTDKNWQVYPDPGLKCTFKMQNFIVTVVLNVITDAGLLCIPLPLLWTLQVPLRRKLVIGILICSGFFVIAAAIIRVVLTLGASPSGTNINRWGVRETIVGIVSVNIPILRPLFTKSFWTGDPHSIRSPYHHTVGKSTTGKSRAMRDVEGSYEMAGSMSDGRPGSQDLIIKKNDPHENEIHVHTSYQVESEDNRSEVESSEWQKDRKVHTKITTNREGV